MDVGVEGCECAMHGRSVEGYERAFMDVGVEGCGQVGRD